MRLELDDFDVLQNIVGVSGPVREATKLLSKTCSCLCDVIPVLTSTLNTVHRKQASKNAEQLMKEPVSAVFYQVGMILVTAETLSTIGGCLFGFVAQNEYAAAFYLCTQYYAVIHAVYGFGERYICSEIRRQHKLLGYQEEPAAIVDDEENSGEKFADVRDSEKKRKKSSTDMG